MSKIDGRSDSMRDDKYDGLMLSMSVALAVHKELADMGKG